jgi:hypothetical protein
MEKFDIVYSVLAHEEPECLLDLVKNILHFNRKYKIKIVINASLNLCMWLDKSIFPPEVSFTPKPKNRIKYSYDLLGGHVDNFIYSENLDFDHYILLASNCMFFKDMDVTCVHNLDCQEPKELTLDPSNPHFRGMFENHLIIDVLDSNGIMIYDLHRFHEGVFYTKDQFRSIKNFLVDTGIHNMEKTVFIAEETLLPTLEVNFFGKMLPHIVNLRLENMEYRIEEASSKIGVCVIKPVPREIDCKERIYLRELIKNNSQQ